jgi:RNA polymerase sigma-70 factor (ECF subfamily)
MSEDAARRRQEFEREALVHLDTLYNVALRLSGNASDADDLVQETVTKAYRAWDKYEPGTNCRAWLVTILRNTFINQVRVGRGNLDLRVGTGSGSGGIVFPLHRGR